MFCVSQENYWQDLNPISEGTTSIPDHLFDIRESQKRGPGTLKTSDKKVFADVEGISKKINYGIRERGYGNIRNFVLDALKFSMSG